MASAHPSTFEGRAHAARPSPRERAVVGPNAAIQLIGALRLATDPDAVRRILATAGVSEWGATLPEAMIDERLAAALHRATRETLDPDRARPVLTEAGARTGDYILANRIPAAARVVLKASPAWIASRLLSRAIAAHAWTFAGSGRFACSRAGGLAFEIAGQPVLRRDGRRRADLRLARSGVRAPVSRARLAGGHVRGDRLLRAGRRVLPLPAQRRTPVTALSAAASPRAADLDDLPRSFGRGRAKKVWTCLGKARYRLKVHPGEPRDMRRRMEAGL